MKELVLTGLVNFLLKHNILKSSGSFEGTLTAFKSLSHNTIFFVSQKKYRRKQNSMQQQLKAALHMVMVRC